ncbi:MAG: hypothetical protein V7637_4277 [Mycobacteriales bacterium]
MGTFGSARWLAGAVLASAIAAAHPAAALAAPPGVDAARVGPAGVGPAGVGTAGVGTAGASVALDRWPATLTAISPHADLAAFYVARTPERDTWVYLQYVRDRTRGVTIGLGVPIPMALGGDPTVALSRDGRYATAYTDVPGAPLQLNVYDLRRQRYTPVSRDEAGHPADGVSGQPALSADGRYTAFVSAATNLVPGDTNGVQDVFVRDRIAGTTRRVSVNGHGHQANDESFWPSISADGRYVTFTSTAGNLVPGDTNRTRDVFIRDRLLGTTRRISLDSRGHQADQESFNGTISADGRYVVFGSDADNLVPGDTDAQPDVFVRDRRYGSTHRVSVSSGGTQADGVSFVGRGSISGDGRYVTFGSYATNLVPGDTDRDQADVFIHDLRYGTTRRFSMDRHNRPSRGSFDTAMISTDDRFLGFNSNAPNLGAAPDDATSVDAFVRDRWGHVNYQVNLDTERPAGR